MLQSVFQTKVTVDTAILFCIYRIREHSNSGIFRGSDSSLSYFCGQPWDIAHKSKVNKDKISRTARPGIYLGVEMLNSQQTWPVFGFCSFELLQNTDLCFGTMRPSQWQIAMTLAKIIWSITQWAVVHRILWCSQALFACFPKNYCWFWLSLCQISVN